MARADLSTIWAVGEGPRINPHVFFMAYHSKAGTQVAQWLGYKDQAANIIYL